MVLLIYISRIQQIRKRFYGLKCFSLFTSILQKLQYIYSKVFLISEFLYFYDGLPEDLYDSRWSLDEKSCPYIIFGDVRTAREIKADLTWRMQSLSKFVIQLIEFIEIWEILICAIQVVFHYFFLRIVVMYRVDCFTS